MNQQGNKAVRRMMTSVPTTDATRKRATKASAEHIKAAAKPAKTLSKAAIMLNDLRPSVEAL